MSLSPKRVARSAVWLLGIALVIGALSFVPAVAQRYRADQSEQVRPVIASNEEWQAIVETILLTEDFGAPPPPPGTTALAEQSADGGKKRRRVVLLESMTKALCLESGAELAQECGVFPLGTVILDDGTRAKFSKSLRRELVAANAVSFPAAIAPRGARILPSEELLAVFKAGEFWDDFYRRFPDSLGMGAFSRAVVNDSRHEALIYFEHMFDGAGGWGRAFRLRRVEDVWRVVERLDLWVS